MRNALKHYTSTKGVRFAFFEWNKQTKQTTRKVNCVLPPGEAAATLAFNKFVPGGYEPARRHFLNKRGGVALPNPAGQQAAYPSEAPSDEVEPGLRMTTEPTDDAVVPTEWRDAEPAPMEMSAFEREVLSRLAPTTFVAPAPTALAVGQSSWCGYYEGWPETLYCEMGETCNWDPWEERYDCNNGCYVTENFWGDYIMHCGEEEECDPGYVWDDLWEECVEEEEEEYPDVTFGCNAGAVVLGQDVSCTLSTEGPSLDAAYLWFKHGDGSDSVDLGSFGSSINLEYAPGLSGSFVTRYYFDGDLLGIASHAVEVFEPPDPVRVFCGLNTHDKTINRGGIVGCFLDYPPKDSLWTKTVTAWQFTPAAGDGYFNLPVVPGGEQPGWEGNVLASGLITAGVRYQRSGATTNFSAVGAVITVNPRLSFPTYSDATLLTAVSEVAWGTSNWPKHWDFGLAYHTNDLNSMTLLGGTGPNAGYAMYPNYLLTQVAKVELNYEAWSLDGPYVQVADGTPTDGSCSIDFISNGLFESIIVLHEGLSNGQASHTGYRRQYVQQNAAAIQERMESIVVAPGGTLPSTATVHNYIYDDNAMQAHVDRAHNHSFNFWHHLCTLRSPANPAPAPDGGPRR